jgi:hypothetical protein
LNTEVNFSTGNLDPRGKNSPKMLKGHTRETNIEGNFTSNIFPFFNKYSGTLKVDNDNSLYGKACASKGSLHNFLLRQDIKESITLPKK